MDKNRLKTLKNQRKNGIIPMKKYCFLNRNEKPTKYRLFLMEKQVFKDENQLHFRTVIGFAAFAAELQRFLIRRQSLLMLFTKENVCCAAAFFCFISKSTEREGFDVIRI